MYYFQELKTLTDPKTLKGVTTNLAETEENKLKNRYVNILPCKSIDWLILLVVVKLQMRSRSVMIMIKHEKMCP